MTDTRSADSPPSEGESQPSEFEDAFTAFANGDEPAPASEPAQEPADSEEAPEPSPEPGGSAAPQSPAEPEAPAEIDWSTLPPAAKAAYDRAVEQAETHRVTLARQGRELHDLRSRPAAPEPPQPPAQAEQPAKGKLSKEQLDALREDYPDLAGPLLDIIDDLSSTVRGTAQQAEDARTSQALERNVAGLDEAMPDWRTWGSDARMADWIATQPRHIREAQERNSQYIVDVGEAVDVLERFKAAHSTTPPAAPAPDPTRNRRLAAGADASTKQPAVASGVPDDFEGAFKSYSAKAEKAKRTI